MADEAVRLWTTSGAKFDLSAGVPKLDSGVWVWVVKDGNPIYLVFGCPCGTWHGFPSNGNLAIEEFNPKEHADWKWNGNWDEPTLRPSIQRRLECRWHGYLVRGKFVLEGPSREDWNHGNPNPEG